MIFYLNDREPDWPFHSMIYISHAQTPGKGALDDWVVYHTGAHNGQAGIVKKLRLADLNAHPNKRWHPIEANPYFLGVYRWKILDQEKFQ